MSPTHRMEASQFMWMHASRLRQWSKHAKNATLHKRAEAVYIADILETFTRLLDPDAVFEARDIVQAIDLQPWLNEVGNDDPTPVEYIPGRTKK